MSNKQRATTTDTGRKSAVPAGRRGQLRRGQSRPRKRRGSKKLYILLTTMIALILVIILSCTVLFDLRTITVTGDTRYSADQVIQASGLVTGMNLVRLNTGKAEASVYAELPYAETVKVTKKFPYDITITVFEPRLEAAVQSGSQIYLVSGKGRVLGTTDTTAGRMIFDGLPIGGGVNGPEVTDVGMLDRLATVLEAIKAQGLEDVTLIRSPSEASSAFVYQGRVTVELGNLDDLAYKLRISAYLLTSKVRSDERGVLDVTLPGKGRFIPDKTAGSESTGSQTSSVSETAAVSGSQNPSSDSISSQTTSASSVSSGTASRGSQNP